MTDSMKPGLRKTYADPLDDLLESEQEYERDLTKEERRKLNSEAGERLMVARCTAHWSRRKLAIALGVARQTLSNWEEHGGAHPKPSWVDEKLKRVAPDVAKELFRSHARELRSVG